MNLSNVVISPNYYPGETLLFTKNSKIIYSHINSLGELCNRDNFIEGEYCFFYSNHKNEIKISREKKGKEYIRVCSVGLFKEAQNVDCVLIWWIARGCIFGYVIEATDKEAIIFAEELQSRLEQQPDIYVLSYLVNRSNKK